MRINALAALIKQQADRLFPRRTDASMFLKMYGETSELISATNPAQRADELADLLIMILDYGSRYDIDIEHAIMTKMAINDRRVWTTNELGVNQHVEQ